MKRKTNIFYLTGDDSKFITFSNYTESLTGNFLSTDTKLFPSRFLCLNLPNLTNDNKNKLIRFLAAYYENKLAVLRDSYIDKNINLEHHILPLNYLLEALMYYFKLVNDGNGIDDSSNSNEIENIVTDYVDVTEQNLPQIDDDNINKYLKVLNNLIVYIGDITEQDYNGTYTDTICIVNLNNAHTAEAKSVEDIATVNNNSIKTEESDTLYGWGSNIVSSYADLKPVYDMKMDDEVYYNSNSLLESLLVKKFDENDTLEFNCVIPLFDVVDINYKTNFVSIESSMNDGDEINLIDETTNNLYTKNVPLGMWFMPSEDSDVVKLYKDSETGYSQSWSLVISSQFKPFPYNDKQTDDFTTNSVANSFATFAQVLTRQNELLDKVNSLSYQFININNRINDIQGQLKQIGTSYNIDGIHQEMIDFEHLMNDNFTVFQNQILAYINNLRWHTAI